MSWKRYSLIFVSSNSRSLSLHEIPMIYIFFSNDIFVASYSRLFVKRMEDLKSKGQKSAPWKKAK